MKLLDARMRFYGDQCLECEKYRKRKRHHVEFDVTDNGVNLQIKIHGLCLDCARKFIEEIKNHFIIRSLPDNQGQWLLPDILWVKRKQVEPEVIKLPAIEYNHNSKPIANDITEGGYYEPGFCVWGVISNDPPPTMYGTTEDD